MVEENKIATIFTATTQGLSDGLNSAGSQIQGFAAKIQGGFSGLGGAISSIQGPLMALGGVLAGGAMFKSAMDATIKWNGEAIKLARTLNITTEEASILNVALGDIYSDTDTYLGALRKMTMQLNSGGEGFKKLGIDTKDSSGKLKESMPLMQETLDKLNKIEGGTQRNAAGALIFGRSWGEAQKLLKLNAQVMEEAAEKAKRLNLIVGGDAVEAQRKYKAAQNDMEDGLLGLKLTIGQEVLPVFTEMMVTFGDVLPPIIKGVSYAIKGLVTGFQVLKFVVEVVAASVGAYFSAMMSGIGMVVDMFNRVRNGDFAGIADDAKRRSTEIKSAFSGAADEIKDRWEKLGDSMAKIWDRADPSSTKTKVGKQGSEEFNPDKQTGMKKWENELAQLKARVFREMEGMATLSEQSELEFWQAKAKIAAKGSEEYGKVYEKIAALQGKVTEDSIKRWQEEQAAAKELNLLKTDDDTNAAMTDLERRRTYFEQRLALGQVSAQAELEQLRKFVEEETAIKVKQLEVEMAMAGEDIVKRTQIQNQLNAVQRKGTSDISKLNLEAATKVSKGWMDSAARMGTAFGTAIGGILNKTMTLQQAMGIILKAALKELLKYVMQVITAKGAEAGAGAAASAAQTPVVGWAMAIPAMAAVLGAVLGLGSQVGSAAGGWDIPAGVNPIGQLHAEEMVLPKEQANVIRKLASGELGGGQGQTVHNHYNISAMDSRSFEDALRSNRVSLAKVSTEMMKDGVKG